MKDATYIISETVISVDEGRTVVDTIDRPAYPAYEVQSVAIRVASSPNKLTVIWNARSIMIG